MRGFVYLFAFRVMYVVFLFQPLQRAQPFTSLGWALIYGVIYTRGYNSQLCVDDFFQVASKC